MYPGKNAPDLRPTRHVSADYPCQEQADIPGLMIYMPCGTPTDGRKFRHKHSGEGSYYFCEFHRPHNVDNRGFEEVTDANPHS